MKSRDENPYASPRAQALAPAKSKPLAKIVPKRGLDIAFGIAVAGPFVGWAGIYLVLGVGLWSVPPGVPVEVGYFVYGAVGWIATAFVIVGTVAGLICFVVGSWSQRALVLLLTVLYAPLLRRIVPDLWHILVTSW